MRSSGENERRLRARRGSSFRPRSAPRRAHAHPRCLSAPRAARAVGPSVVCRPVAAAASGATRGSRRRGTRPDQTRVLCRSPARGPAADRAEPSNFGECGAGAAAGVPGFRCPGLPRLPLGRAGAFPYRTLQGTLRLKVPVSERSPSLWRNPACLRVPCFWGTPLRAPFF